MQMIRLQGIVHAELAHDARRTAGADGAVGVVYRIGQLHLFAVLEKGPGIPENLFVERIPDIVALLPAATAMWFAVAERHKQRPEIEIVEIGRTARNLGQQIGATDNLVDRPGPYRGQNLARLAGIEGHQIDHLLGGAGKFGP